MTRRPDVTAVLAVLLPVITVAALVFVRSDAGDGEGSRPPATSPLLTATLVCPGGGTPLLSTKAEKAGPVQVRRAKAGSEPQETTLTAGRVTEPRVEGTSPVIVNGEGELAPGLTGTVTAEPLAAGRCREPVADQWFTGVGAGARHSSVVELVNPDTGPAVVDLIVHGRGGLVDAPELRGIIVPAGKVVRVDLAKEVPTPADVALHVVTSRGRVATMLPDHYDELGRGATADDWLAPQTTPSTSNLLLGIPEGTGQRILTVANPGDSEARATLQLVTERSVFTPSGVDEIVVPPNGVAQVLLSEALQQRDLADAIGFRVTSQAPLTATVRSFAGGDLSNVVGGDAVSSSTAVVPRGDKQVVLGGAERAGTVMVTARDDAGEVVTQRRVDVVAERGAVVDVAPEAVLVDVTARSTRIVGAVQISDGDAATVVPLTALLTGGLLADIEPGLN